MEPTKERIEKEAEEYSGFRTTERYKKIELHSYIAAATVWSERAQQELQAYRDMIKDLLPLAEEVFDSITIDDGASHRQYIQLQAMILRARKLIDIATPTSNPEQS